jgi:LysM repeat protein
MIEEHVWRKRTIKNKESGADMTRHTVVSILMVGMSSIFLAGCVMTEKYEAEKARALNFQRLLAQEEKRTGELDSELKRVKREAGDLEAKNRELTAQVQALREQLAKIQEEVMMKEAMTKEQEGAGRSRKPGSKPRRAEKGLSGMSQPPGVEPGAMKVEGDKTIYHQVKPGETLFGISRQYGVDVKTLKGWNNLREDAIEVGQRLVVGHE